MNLADLRRTLGVDGDGGCGGMGNSTKGHASEADDDGLYGADSKARRRLSMERMDLLKVCLCSSAFVALLFLASIFSHTAPSRSNLGRWEIYRRLSKTSIFFFSWQNLQHGDFIIIFITVMIVFVGPFQFRLLAL
jgi:hypothetical protein